MLSSYYIIYIYCLYCILHTVYYILYTISNAQSHPILGKRSFPKDLLPIYTRDVACIIIQRKWRAILLRQFLRALCRAQHDEVWDPVKGRFNYYHRDSETLHQEKPKLLGTTTTAATTTAVLYCTV